MKYRGDKSIPGLIKEECGPDELTRQTVQNLKTVMKNKYYTPTLKELLFNIVTEGCCYTRLENKKVSMISFKDIEFVHALYEFIQTNDYNRDKGYSINPKIYLLKYLDREDLESLGFIMYSSWEWSYHNKNGNIGLIYTTNFSNKGKEIFISITTPFENEAGIEIKFSGYIKNKSELKKILEQVGIIK